LPCLRFYYKLGYFQNDENAFFLKINISLWPAAAHDQVVRQPVAECVSGGEGAEVCGYVETEHRSRQESHEQHARMSWQLFTSCR
jgi:hypothetical protein